MIKIEMILTDDCGIRISVDKSYEGGLTGKTLDEVEQLVYKAIPRFRKCSPLHICAVVAGYASLNLQLFHLKVRDLWCDMKL